MAMALRPLDGVDGRDCKRRFLLEMATLESYRMKKEEVLKSISVVLSSADGYRFKAQ